jgi:ribosomal protein S18 acetylase RimI-like enzyme
MSVFFIRDGVAADAPLIAAFNAAMARETEALELDPNRLLAGVRAVFDDPAKGFYLLAEQDSEVIGQLLITYEWSDWRNGVFWWIQSVYVQPEARGRGVYNRLYREAVQRAERQGDVCGLRLYVERENERAQRVYRRLGMSPTAYRMYETDFVLERNPTPGV